MFRALGAVASAARLHRVGRGFESLSAHHASVAHAVERSSEKAEVAGAHPARGTSIGGSSSGAERLVANEKVAGANPVSRSKTCQKAIDIL